MLAKQTHDDATVTLVCYYLLYTPQMQSESVHLTAHFTWHNLVFTRGMYRIYKNENPVQ